MISIEKLNKKYKNKIIFKNADIKLPDTGMYILTGPNGVGKTTLLNIIGLVDDDYRGNVYVDGLKISDNQDIIRSKYICYINQKNNLVTFLSPKENYYICSELNSAGNKSEGDMWFNASKNSCLSDGEKIILALNRGFNAGRKIFLLDEVSALLDRENTKKVMERLFELSKTCLVIFVNHDSRLQTKIPDGYIEIKDGKLIMISCDRSLNKPDANLRLKSELSVEVKHKSKTQCACFLAIKVLLSHMGLFLLASFLIGFSLALSLSCASVLTLDIRQVYEDNMPEERDYRFRNVNKQVIHYYDESEKRKIDIDCDNGIKKEAEKELDKCAKYYLESAISSVYAIRFDPSIEKGKIFLSSSYYSDVNNGFSDAISGDSITFSFGDPINYELKVPFQVKNDKYTADGMSANSDWFSQLMPSSSICVPYGWWRNDQMSFPTVSSLNSYFIHAPFYISQSLFESKNKVNLGYKIADDCLVLGSSYMSAFTCNDSSFPTFEDFGLHVDKRTNVDMNEVFRNGISTKVDLRLNKYVKDETVIISDNAFLKLKAGIDEISSSKKYTITKNNRESIIDICSKQLIYPVGCAGENDIKTAVTSLGYYNSLSFKESIFSVIVYLLIAILFQLSFYLFIQVKEKDNYQLLLSFGLKSKNYFLMLCIIDLLSAALSLAIGIGLTPSILEEMLSWNHMVHLNTASVLIGLSAVLIGILLHMLPIFWSAKKKKS